MKVYTFLTDGFETVEALAVIDILRRAGIEVETVSITGNEQVCSAQNITIKADTLFKAQPVRKEDVLFLPGGPGHKQYNECKPLLELLERYHAEGGRIAAICAAPSILGHLGILNGKKATAKFTCSDGERHTLTFVVSGNGIKVTEKSYCDQKLIGWSSADKYETTITHGFYPQSHFY